MPSDLDRLVGISTIIDATGVGDVVLQPMRKALRFKGSGFVLTEAADAIDIELTGIGGAQGPVGNPGATGATGPTGSLATIGRLDATYSPIVLWSGNETLTDSSGNGRTATVSTGTVVYSDLWPGYRGFSLQSCRLSYTNAAVQLTGDLTIEGVFVFDAAPNGTALYCHSASGETSGANFLYGQYVLASRLPSWLSESGAGVDATFVGTITALPPPGQPFHFCTTRIGNIIRNYVDGTLIGVASGALTTPTGGASGSLFLGGETGTTHPSFLCADFKVIGAGLDDSQVAAEAERTIGQLY